MSTQTEYAYERLAGELADQVRSGTLAPGERIPSVRELCRERSCQWPPRRASVCATTAGTRNESSPSNAAANAATDPSFSTTTTGWPRSSQPASLCSSAASAGATRCGSAPAGRSPATRGRSTRPHPIRCPFRPARPQTATAAPVRPAATAGRNRRPRAAMRRHRGAGGRPAARRRYAVPRCRRHCRPASRPARPPPAPGCRRARADRRTCPGPNARSPSPPRRAAGRRGRMACAECARPPRPTGSTPAARGRRRRSRPPPSPTCWRHSAPIASITKLMTSKIRSSMIAAISPTSLRGCSGDHFIIMRMPKLSALPITNSIHDQ